MKWEQRGPTSAAGALLLVACAGAIQTERGAAGPRPEAAPPAVTRSSEATPAKGNAAEASAVDDGVLADALALADASAPTFADDGDPGEARVAFAEDGTIGAWLVAGPFDRARLPDESKLSPRLGQAVGDLATGPRWRLAWASSGVVDLAAALEGSARTAVAYAGAQVHLVRGGRHVLLVGVDDGLSVFVDGRELYSQDRARARHDDDDLIAIDLAPGDHSLVLALRRRMDAWALRARLLDPDLAPPPGGWWRLAGTSVADARALAANLSSLAFDRGMGPDGYRPILTVRFRGGAPLGVPIDVQTQVHARADGAGAGADPAPPFDAGPIVAAPDATADRLVALPEIAPDAVEDNDWIVHVDIAGRTVDLPFHPRRAVREAVAHAGRALAAPAEAGLTAIAPASLDTVAFLRQRLAGFVAKGDGDVDAELADARELDDVATAIDQGRDPYPVDRSGPMRRAYVSPVDGHFSEFAVYVPPRLNPARRYPLIVALHGMNGYPMEMLMWLFGHDDPDRDGAWEDRHPRKNLEPLDAVVVAPDGHFNAMYRDLGEDDVMRVIDWAKAHYPIDSARVTITGPSMGGIGSAACALHYPDRFAAAEPLCGYHSYFVRGDIGGRSIHPWERFLAEQRSNVFWAENGLYLPLYIVHGTKDLPEENSGVLIDRYTELHYEVEHEHPELGHNVWQPTYEDLKGAQWLLPHRRPLHPSHIRFKTPSTRWADDAWVHVREMASNDGWGEVIARIEAKDAVSVVTRGVTALAFDRDSVRMDDAAPLHVNIDGTALVFQAGEAIELHAAPSTAPRAGDALAKPAWNAGPAVHPGLFKHGTVTGPLHDIFHEPILFVWGKSDPTQARANEEVARAWARVRWGVRVDYPMMSDTDFFAQGESVANDKALFLVGNAASNRVVRELEPDFPIRIDGSAVVAGARRIEATDGAADRSELGAAFIRPNPRRPERYVVVVEGVGPLGTWRSMALPDLLPDYVIFDRGIAPARGQLIMGAATTRAAGFFGQDWSLPSASAVP